MATTYDKASLVMIPSGYKDDKLYSVKPTDGSGDFTFSRDGSGASPATRVNASGLIEKGRENILTYSNDFSNVAWTKVLSSVTGGQSGYDGTNNAWRFESTAIGLAQLTRPITNNALNSFSIYAKAGNISILKIWVGSEKAFDLANGTTSSTDSKITQVGASGWYRCEVFNTHGSFNPFLSATGAGQFVYIQSAQAELGLVATDYIETTTAAVSAGLLGDMPRLDYSGGATCPSLLLEPSRANAITQSEYFGASWSASNITITSNATTSPEGVDNATLLANTSASNYLVYGASVSASTTYQFSFYAKNVDATAANVIFYDASNSAVISTTAYEGDLTTEWKRLDFSVTTPVGCTSLNINIVNGLAGSLYVYGAQFEEGSYPTSYIPTYGSASTRGDDFCSKTSITSLIGQSEGAAYIEFDPRSGTGERRFFLQIGSGSTTIYARIESGGTLTAQILNSGTDYLTSTGTSISSGTNKFAVAYANNDAVFYLNGTQLATSSSVIVPALSALYVGSNSSGAQQIGGDVKQSVLFKTRLTNAELASLTTI